MIRVLIAEDEPPILRRMVRMIENAGLPFEVAATAFDGAEALREMEKQPCDVIFTDVKMPVMDGLTLVERVQETYPDCQVVIVSGYQEFAYVARAIRANAKDYLLKPVSQEAMQEMLIRLREAYEKRRSEALTNKISAAISGIDNLGEFAPSVGEEQSEHFHVALFCAGPMPLSEDNELLAGNEVFEKFLLEESFKEIAPDYHGFLWAFMGNTPVEQLLIFSGATEEPGIIIRALTKTIGRQSGIFVSAAYSMKSVTLPQIGEKIRVLKKQLSYAVEIGSSVLLPVDLDNPPRIGLLDTDIAGSARSVADWLGQGASLSAQDWAGILAEMREERLYQRRVYDIFLRALTYLEAEKGLTESILQARDIVTEIMETALTREEILNGFSNLSSLFVAEKEGQVTQKNVAAQVEEYLQKNYDQHINTQTLGAVFGYVPSYISLLFRKAYGLSPSEYLTQVRLEHAKRMIRYHPEILIRDIAEKVGFKNPHHFSKTFKKHEGVWPTDYATEGGAP